MTSKLGTLPDGVDSAMYLRDGWPYAVVCKVTMKDGCIGIGVFRNSQGRPLKPETADHAALTDAIVHLAPNPPDYTELHEHVAKMAKLAADEAERRRAQQEKPETDEDLQAALGQKAHD